MVYLYGILQKQKPVLVHQFTPSQPPRRRLDQTGAIRYIVLVLFLVAVITSFRSTASHALSAGSAVRSGIAGSCLDVRHDSRTPDTAIDDWQCNDSAAQAWVITSDAIVHDDSRCLSVENNATIAGSPVVLNTCNNDPGQVWLRDQTGFENPNSGLCLAVSSDSDSAQTVLATCKNIDQATESWTSAASNSACSGSEGQKVACTAEQQWTLWQSADADHENLLNGYTDGAPYEEWCADFVSYVYKTAGYPFSGGETNGWDENIASNIQYMGFTRHEAGSYVPQPGDVAYFDYPGGHVEIVVSGGKTPTFIYGNSHQIDPATGNGEMETNTVTSDGTAGHVLYYLSPNGG